MSPLDPEIPPAGEEIHLPGPSLLHKLTQQGLDPLPHFAGGLPPDPDPESHGALIGLSTAVDRGTLFRAVLEGLAQAQRREFASDSEVEAAFRRFDR